MFINKTKKRLITMLSLIAGIAFILCIALGFIGKKIEKKTFATVETLEGVTFLGTKSWKSEDEDYFLLVTGFTAPTITSDTENEYIVGYEINGEDTLDNFGKKYYEGITVNTTGGLKTYTASDIYNNDDYSDYYLIVYEISDYSPTADYHVKAFIKQIESDDTVGYDVLKDTFAIATGTPIVVTYNDTPNATFSGDLKTLYKEDYSFSVTPDEGYSVDVYVNNSLVEETAGVYTVPASNVTGDLDVLIDAYSTTDLIYDFEDSTQPLAKHFSSSMGGTVMGDPSTDQHFSGSYSLKIALTGNYINALTFKGIRAKISALKENPLYADYNLLSFKIYVAGSSWTLAHATDYTAFGIHRAPHYAAGEKNIWSEVLVPVSAMLSDNLSIVPASASTAYIDDIRLVYKSANSDVYDFESYDVNADVSNEFNNRAATIATDYTYGGTGKSVKIAINNNSWDGVRFTSLYNNLSWISLLRPEATILQFRMRVVADTATTVSINGSSYKIFGASVSASNNSSSNSWTTVQVPVSSITSYIINWYSNGSGYLYFDDIRLIEPVSEYSLYTFEDADERATITAGMAEATPQYFKYVYNWTTTYKVSISNEYATTTNGYSLKIDCNEGNGIWGYLSRIEDVNAALAIEGATFNTLTFKVYCPVGSVTIPSSGAVFGYAMTATTITSEDGWVTVSVPLASITADLGCYFRKVTAGAIYIDDIKLVTV